MAKKPMPMGSKQKPGIQTPEKIAKPSKPASGGSDTSPYSSARKGSKKG